VSGGHFCATGTATLTQQVQQAEHSLLCPAGLVINTTTGVIDLAASTPEHILLLIVLVLPHVMALQQIQ
jgi:hypothetical protein